MLNKTWKKYGSALLVTVVAASLLPLCSSAQTITSVQSLGSVALRQAQPYPQLHPNKLMLKCPATAVQGCTLTITIDEGGGQLHQEAWTNIFPGHEEMLMKDQVVVSQTNMVPN